MLSLPPTVRVFVAIEPLDMRGSFDALAGAVRRLANTFSALFGSDEHLDIMFLSEDSERELKKVCRPFFQA